MFFLRNTTHAQKTEYCSTDFTISDVYAEMGEKTVKEGEAFSLNYQWFEIWSVISGQQNIKIFHIEDIFRMCICVCAH